MLLFFKKLRQQLLSENKFYKYLLYALGELILVVIGILIALQINNWNNRRIEKQEESQQYRNIKQQIVQDSVALRESRQKNKLLFSQFLYANQIIVGNDQRQIDTLALISLNLSQYSDFNRSGNIYETLVNSGNINLLSNDEIVKHLQELEMTYNHINKLEDIHWELIIKELSPELKGVINYSNQQVLRPEKLYSVELQNIIIELIFLTKAKDTIYGKALEEIQIINDLIDKEPGVYQINK